MGALFIVGLLMTGYSVWFFLKDYICAKSDHENKPLLSKLMAFLVLGTLMASIGAVSLNTPDDQIEHSTKRN